MSTHHGRQCLRNVLRKENIVVHVVVPIEFNFSEANVSAARVPIFSKHFVSSFTEVCNFDLYRIPHTGSKGLNSFCNENSSSSTSSSSPPWRWYLEMSSGGVLGASVKNILEMNEFQSFEMSDLLRNVAEYADFHLDHQLWVVEYWEDFLQHVLKKNIQYIILKIIIPSSKYCGGFGISTSSWVLPSVLPLVSPCRLGVGKSTLTGYTQRALLKGTEISTVQAFLERLWWRWGLFHWVSINRSVFPPKLLRNSICLSTSSS